MNLDLVAAALCGWMAVCIFGLHIVSSPHRHRWMTLPEYVRRGLLVTATMFTWRSVNFATLRGDPIGQPGHINVEGIMASLALAYMVTSLVVWAWSKHLPGTLWGRMEWLERHERSHPLSTPMPVTERDINILAKAKGITINTELPTRKGEP